MAARFAGSLDYLFRRLFGLRVVSQDQFDRAARAEAESTEERRRAAAMAYRAVLKDAEARGDSEFLRRELEGAQLTREDLSRLRRHHTPVASWPDEAKDPFEPQRV